MVAAVRAMVAAGHDPFVRVRLDPALTVLQANRACGLLAGLDNEAGMRVEPTDPDQLYYRGYIPDESNRRRADRIQQPWELRLTNAAAATLFQIEERWHDNELKPELIVTEHPLAAPADLRAALDRLGPGMPVILVFAAPQLTVGSVMRWVQDVRKTHGYIHVYCEE